MSVRRCRTNVIFHKEYDRIRELSVNPAEKSGRVYFALYFFIAIKYNAAIIPN
jgi:hypothetical protein